MSVYPTEVVYYGSLDMPEADGSTVGGAVDVTKRVSFADLTGAAATLQVVSSSASDTATKCQVGFRAADGTVQTPAAVTLTGTTKVTVSATAAQRLLYGAISGANTGGPLANPGGTAAVGDVAVMSSTLTITGHTAQAGSANHTGATPPLFHLQSGDGASVTLGMVIRTTGGTGPNQIRYAASLSGTGSGQYGTDIVAVNRDWSVVPDATTTYEVAPGFVFDLLPNPVTAIIRPFVGATSAVVGGGTTIYYEKLFVLNTDASTALQAVAVAKEIDPTNLYSGGGALDFALTTALNDTATVTNRQTAPTGVGSYSSGAAPQSINVPSPGNLPSGNTAAGAQGVWMRLTLPAGLAPNNSSFEMQTNGTTT